MNRLVAVTTDAQGLALLRQHPRFEVVFTAPSGTERRPLAPTTPATDAGPMGVLMLTTDEAATLLALSERQVRKLIAAKEVPAVHVGRSVRIRRRDLEAYVERLGQPVGGAA